MSALESRHLADLRVAEVTRALRALSSAYVERRHKVASGGTLDSAGKRAAFALYFGPLHFLATAHVLAQLGAGRPSRIVDLGCGTGVAGAAWALRSADAPRALTGIDRHPWAVEETRRTYRDLGLAGHARVGDLIRVPSIDGADAVLAGYLLNELNEAARRQLEDHLAQAAAAGTQVLIMEPIARGVAPWWDAMAARFAAVGARADEWRFQPDVPDIVSKLGKAAGLNFREVRLRTLYAGPLSASANARSSRSST
jgi:SAM-dependent methyltransferase